MATQTRAAGAGWNTYRLSVGQYLKMIGAGVFPDDARVELLGGFLIESMANQAPHNFSASQTGHNLRRISQAGWFISEGKSLVLGRYWRPEPDIAVIRGPNDLYRARDPRAADVALLAEVAESSYALDRGRKWRAYAAARIPAYWIVNLPGRQIESYGDPAGRGQAATYRAVDLFGPEAEVPVVIDGREVGRVAVRDVLP